MPGIRVGIIGTGGMGGRHAAGALATQGSLTLAAACDNQPAHLDTFCAKYPVPLRSGEWRRIVESDQLDAVFVLLPHDLHEEVCVAAAEAGKHILVEKPIARTAAEARAVIAAADAAGVTLMVAHNQRFFPAHRTIRRLLDEAALGELFCGRIDHHQDFAPAADRAWWRSRQAVGGGCVMGSGIHRLDLLRWYFGEAEQVFAYHVGDPRRLEAEVASVAAIRFRGGAAAEFFCNWGVTRGPAVAGESISLFGRDGCLYYDGEIRVSAPRRPDIGRGLTVVPPGEGHESMWAHFARCVETGAVPLTSGPEGLKSLQLVQAICRSAETGLPVDLPAA